MMPPVMASLISPLLGLTNLIKEAKDEDITLGISLGEPYWLKSIMAFINKGISKSNIASMIFKKGPKAIIKIWCLYDSDTLLII